MPVDYQLQKQEDGSKTLLINDVDQMYGTKAIAAFTLYLGKAYIEIRQERLMKRWREEKDSIPVPVSGI